MGKLTCLCTALLLFFSGCRQVENREAKKKNEILVAVFPAAKKEMQGSIETVGTLSAASTVEVRPQIKGTIQAIFVREGKTVEEGTPLFQIDPRTHQYKFEELQNDLASNQIKLKVLLQKQERFQNISNPNLISKSDRESLDLEIEQLKLEIASDEIKVKSAKLNCDNCLIRAPIHGRLGKVYAQIGQWVSEGDDPLTTIDKIDRLFVTFHLSEEELLKLHQRPIPFTVTSLAQPQNFCPAFCNFIDHQVNSKTGTIRLEGIIANTESKFRKSQIVKVLIEGHNYHDAIIIPTRAVKVNETGSYVYKISPENEALLTPVIVETEIDNWAIIKSGIDAGDEIVTEGHLRLYPGAKIRRQIEVS